MNTQSDQPAWGRLLEDARKAIRPKMGVRRAAERAGISEGRWRQITKGYQATGGGHIPVPGPAETLARMAEAVGVLPEQMAAAGRPDVAGEMEALRSVGVTELGDLWLSDSSEELAELRAWLDAVTENESLPPPVKPLMLWDYEQLLEAAAAKIRDEMRLKDHFIQVLGDRPSQKEVEDLKIRLDAALEALSDQPPSLGAVAKTGTIEDPGENSI